MLNRNRSKAKLYPLRTNPSRVVEAVLCVIELAQEQGLRITQYDIVKSLFLADKNHLNKYGRPITFDNYVAMKHGPVPSFAYDLLKENARAVSRAGKLPWSRRESPELGNGCFAFENAQRSPDENVLSISDVEELSSALTVIKSLGFSQIRKLTHEDQAYIDAWEDTGGNQFPMSYALFFETPSAEKAAELSFFSQHI